AVAPAVLAARGQRRRRTPKGHDVVGELVGRRQLDQVDLARAPGPQRLHPAVRALLVGRLQVLVVLEAALALHQGEAARIVVLEAAVLDRARIAQWTPRLPAGAGEQQQAVGVVHRRARVVDAGAVVGID